jgi:hypothetical protein
LQSTQRRQAPQRLPGRRKISGQQIGTVVGGAIGAYFGGPAGAQLGMAIGGAIGGAVAPTHVNGPKIGDGQQQTATDGAPIAWVQGTAMIAGTIVQVSSRRQIRHKDNGKGGSVAVTFTAVQDFAILICESSELRDSTVNSILMVLQDGKLVYDVRVGSTMLADSYKWRANVDFLFGDEEQLPHPTLEAITGVGNTPAYRGSCVAVFKSFDVSQAGDRIPNFQFVVSNAPGIASQAAWKYYATTLSDSTDYSASSFDDTAWPVGGAPFGNLDRSTPPGKAQYIADFNSSLSATIRTPMALDTRMWIRRKIYLPQIPPSGFQLIGWLDNGYAMYVNGVEIDSGYSAIGAGISKTLTSDGFVEGDNILAVRCDDDATTNASDVCYFDFLLQPLGLPSNTAMPVPLSGIVERICERGGLDAADVEKSALDGITVMGYPIARQANAADCLLPLLQTYFGFASEYDAQLHFKLYGEDAVVAVDRADLIEGNDSNNGAIVSNLRNQSTEFPRRVVGSYMDPAQNYTVVDTAAERRAVDVIAIGDQSFQIPVVMAADDAARAVDKALKVAYATLEGTLEYSTPLAGSDVYLSLAAGEPLSFQGKRYVADELILGSNNMKLTTRYDRQSAYTSNVQAVLGQAPTPPASPYSGPTTLIPMNLPSLRPQDTYGVYLAASSSDGRSSWVGCTVQASYDNQASWQNALQITEPSVFGELAVNEPVGGEPLTVQVNGDLESVTDDQLAASANAFALMHAAGAEIGQFKMATETTTAHEYELTNVTRGGLGTTEVPSAAGEQFVMLDAVYFLPIDISFKGKTIYFRAVGFGEVAEDADVVSAVYNPDTTVIHDGGVVTP